MSDSTSNSETPEEREKRLYKEKLKSLTMIGGQKNGRYVFRDKPNMSFDGAIQGEHRADGSFMPYVRESDHIPVTRKMRTDMGEKTFQSAVNDAKRGTTRQE